ncbi:polyadenylate-binding protein RBP47-like protein [Tanacetum coccineum]
MDGGNKEIGGIEKSVAHEINVEYHSSPVTNKRVVDADIVNGSYQQRAKCTFAKKDTLMGNSDVQQHDSEDKTMKWMYTNVDSKMLLALCLSSCLSISCIFAVFSAFSSIAVSCLPPVSFLLYLLASVPCLYRNYEVSLACLLRIKIDSDFLLFGLLATQINLISGLLATQHLVINKSLNTLLPKARHVKSGRIKNQESGTPPPSTMPKDAASGKKNTKDKVGDKVATTVQPDGKEIFVTHKKQSQSQIFVGGLDTAVSNEDLKQPFSQYGEIVLVKIPIGKGWGFVQFVNSSDFLTANTQNIDADRDVRSLHVVNCTSISAAENHGPILHLMKVANKANDTTEITLAIQ